MAKIGEKVSGLLKREYAPLCLLLLIVLALHLSTILRPASPVFDGQYYVPAARSILQGQGTDRIEQPPLGQLIISGGILAFGDNPFGWRFFSVLAGLAGIALFYLICRRLGMASRYAFLGAFLFSFENLSFIQSSVAMLDAFSLTFMLAGFWLYLRGSHASSGAAIGLAALCKLTGVLALAVILLYWLGKRVLRRSVLEIPLNPSLFKPGTGSFPKGETGWKDKGRYGGILFLIVSALASFWLLMPLLEFAIWRQWHNPFSQVHFMLKANALATFSTAIDPGMLSRPWDWVLRPEILTYWISPHYVAMVSPPVWALIIPAMGLMVYEATAGLSGGEGALFALAWFAGTYLAWIPFSLITGRISYIYYFYPAVGSVCLALALAAAEIDKAGERRGEGLRRALLEGITPIYLVLCLGAFVILSPVSYWWKLPLSAAAYLLARYDAGAKARAGAALGGTDGSYRAN